MVNALLRRAQKAEEQLEELRIPAKVVMLARHRRPKVLKQGEVCPVRLAYNELERLLEGDDE